MNGYNAYVAANPYPTLTVYSTGFGDEIGVVTGHTGYTGPNTGYDSPSEGIGGPNALGNSQLSSGQNQPGYSALGGEDSPSERIGGPGTLNYDSAAAVNQAIANGADPYTFQQSASAPAQAPSGADPYTFQQSASAPAQAPGGVDPYTFQQSASAAAQAQSGWALPGYEGAADNGATQTQSDITVTVHSIRLARRFHEGAPRTSPTKRRPTP